MRLITVALLTLTMLVLSGCMKGREGAESQQETQSSNTTPAENRGAADSNAPDPQQAKMQTVSLNEADKSQTAAAAVERKIIRNADLTLEVSDPAENQRRITSVAESRGGFVVTSDATQRQNNDQTRPEMTIKVVVRVPATQFNAALDEIRGTATRILQEKTTGQDVTEEFIDLEARIRTKRALEAQFLEIMKQAKNVTDALEVQSELASVRTEIERLEGRRRFLENQASLSTITVMLQSQTPIVSTTGFMYSVREAFKDGVDLASGITLFFIRALITLLPVALFIFLPLALLARYFIRRMRRVSLARELTREEPLPASKSS